MSGTEIYKTSCPNCGGQVSYFWWDEHYESGSGPITCAECKRQFNTEEWAKIAAKEIAAKEKAAARAHKRAMKAWQKGKTAASIGFAKKAEAYIKRHLKAVEMLQEAVAEIKRGEWVLDKNLSLKEGVAEKKKRDEERKKREEESKKEYYKKYFGLK